MVVNPTQYNYPTFDNNSSQEGRASNKDSGNGNTLTRIENVQFVDAELSERNEIPMISPTYDADDDTYAGLKSFVERPVRIASVNWLESNLTVLMATYQPWSLVANNTIIKNKLTNFARMRAKLRIKVVINASPFYYGALRLCYDPMQHNVMAGPLTNDLMPYSQMPGVWLFPQELTSVEMELPFLWPSNWLDLTDASLFTRIGNLYLVQYAQLRSATSATGQGATVTIYGSFEDVELMGPTNVAILQSDEYVEGPISAPATAVANIASSLTQVPYVGELARATEVGARAVASVAQLFGYTNPPNIEPVGPVRNVPFHGLASSELSTPIDKLSLDPKNEVTVDPASCGADGTDPLAFENFLCHESWIATTTWSNAGTYPPETNLLAACVSPVYSFPTTGVSQTIYHNTPLGFAGDFFDKWRGTIVYRFKFIKSRYHTGRVAITWDPEYSGATYVSDQTVLFTRIVDITTEDEVEIEVPYKSISPWLSTTSNDASISTATAGTVTYNAQGFNGVLRMRVLNVLTGPDATPVVPILVFTRAGRDFRYNVPHDFPNDLHYGVVQSGEEVITGAPPDPASQMAALTIGEQVASLRPLLMRTHMYRRQFVAAAGTLTTYRTSSGSRMNFMFLPRLPSLSGYRFLPAPVSMDFSRGILTTGAKEYNYVHNSPLNVLAPCFVGQRGSVNYHFFPGQDVSTNFDLSDFFRVIRDLSNDWAEVVALTYPTRNVDYWGRDISNAHVDLNFLDRKSVV